MINGVELIFLGRIIPHAGIDYDPGLILSVNRISLIISLNLALFILFRCAKDIIAGTDFAGSILNEVIIRQRGPFDQVQPGSRVVVICRIKVICGTSRITQ